MDELKRVNIEVSSKCNYRCVGCPNSELLRGNGDMESQLFFKIFEEIGNRVNQVMLWNYGEPLLHPEIDTLLEGIREYKCKKTMSTTGWKLSDFEDLSFMQSLDEVIVSINGLTQDTYRTHQRGGKLAKVVRGVKKLSEAIDRSKTRLIMQTLVTKDNIKQVDTTESFARDVGFSELVLKSFNVMDGKQETFDKFVPSGTTYSRYMGATPANAPKPNVNPPCLRWMVINWDGSVNPCCWDYRGDHILGNVKDNGVYAVWDSVLAKEHRLRVRENRFLSICIDCGGSKSIRQVNLHPGDKYEGTKSI